MKTLCGAYSCQRAKIGKFLGNWEIWGGFDLKLFTFVGSPRSAKKSFSSMQKLFDQLENLYLRKVSILFASTYYISVLNLTGIWIQKKTIVATISTNTNISRWVFQERKENNAEKPHLRKRHKLESGELCFSLLMKTKWQQNYQKKQMTLVN